MSNAGKDHDRAVRHAKANANNTKTPWHLFLDIAGTYWLHKNLPARLDGLTEIVLPDGYRLCETCGTCQPEARLNIEGHIHHKTPVECLDRKACERRRRRRKHSNPAA